MVDLKRKSNIGDVERMFLYGKRLLSQNKKIGMDYIRLAAKNGYVPAKNFYNYNRKNNCSLENDNGVNSSDFNESDNHKNKKSIVHLRDDKSFDQKDIDFDTIIKDVKKNIDKDYAFDIDEEKLLHKNLILTDGAKERLSMLKKYIDAGVPVILEGPTGTSKTLSTEIICELTDREIIRFNISVEIPVKPFCEIEMNKNFRSIATQNPNKGLFIHKRNDLGNNFKSRFQVINFHSILQVLKNKLK